MDSGNCTWCNAHKDNKLGLCKECGRFPHPEPVELMGQKWHPDFLGCHPGLDKALRSGEIEGVKFKLLEGDIEPGDTYIAERNVGLQLLTCKYVNVEDWWIQPVEPKYPYDIGECIKIELILD